MVENLKHHSADRRLAPALVHTRAQTDVEYVYQFFVVEYITPAPAENTVATAVHAAPAPVNEHVTLPAATFAATTASAPATEFVAPVPDFLEPLVPVVQVVQAP